MRQHSLNEPDDSRAYRVLIADDSVFARSNIAKVVEAVGGTVVAEAANGKVAVDKYFELKPDLVLLDVSMPEMEGLEALKIIRERDSSAKIVIVSAVGSEGLVKKSISLGAKHFISKPFRSENAASIVRFVLEGEGKGHEG